MSFGFNRHVQFCALVVAALALEPARGQTPLGTAFTYQGQLKQSGSPAGGNFNMVFKLWNDPALSAPANQVGPTLIFDGAGGNPPPVAVASGLFTIQLDFGGTAYNGDKRWLEITVSGTTLSPRQQLTAAPYARFSTAPWGTNGSDISNTNGGNVGIGTSSPTVPLHVVTSGLTAIRAESSGTTGQSTTGYFQTSSDTGNAIFATATSATGSATGVRGYSSAATGTGVYGRALSSSGPNYGVYGESASASGSGVKGFSTSANAGSGVYGQCDSTTGIGVIGYATALSGGNYGGEFESDSTSGTGVFGYAYAFSGATYGVYGRSESTAGRGVFGWADAATGAAYGVQGQSDSTAGIGVVGRATAATGTNYGVYGQANIAATGYAVYANGDMGASGVKPFRIDHPDDPANKYLLHYAAESPEVINFYSGNATLDGAGQAVVELPHYFAKINKDPRYTLTAVGAPMPMLHISEKISAEALTTSAKMGPGEAAPICTFRIAGGVAGGEVSWEVKALRNDRWVQKRGAPVDVEKQNLEKGTYQHPELYNQPPEKGMYFEAEQKHSQPPVVSDATPR